ncbi:MAG: hypothetical protein QM214_03305 [Bacillota bacterium]|jgi:hypothetical protein|nr:hypothetical protein [Bacillota bacterium]HHU43813.1 hypothetical protein [Clostridiales bacterium]
MEKSIELIVELTNKLMKTNLLVLDKDISYFLSKIAEDKNLCDIIKECNINYSFYDDWEKANKLEKIYLPINKRDTIAFVMGLIYKLDTKEISIIELLTKFFPNTSDMQHAYDLLCKQALVPLRDAFISVLKGECMEEVQSDKKAPVLDKMVEDISDWLKVLIQNIQSGKYSLGENCEKEILFFAKGLLNCIDLNDTYLIKLVWLGLINTTFKYAVRFKELSQIQKLFKLYGIDMEI